MDTHTTATPTKTVNPETGTKYSRQELKDAFEMVQDPTNWKNPIDATIPIWAEEVVSEAIAFYAGCRPTITRHKLNASQSHSRVYSRVQAVGYYAAVGA